MSTTEIKENVYWVGAVDWNIRDFHGYSTYKGSTYNAYLVMDEKIALFDTVKSNFKRDLIHQIYQVTDPKKIDYLIVNHVEMDHSGSLPEMMELIQPELPPLIPIGQFSEPTKAFLRLNQERKILLLTTPLNNSIRPGAATAEKIFLLLMNNGTSRAMPTRRRQRL